jgi:hypothetical protein
MARYSATYSSVTTAALADTVAATNATYPGSLRSGGATLMYRINEVEAAGESSASTAICPLILARASTISVGALSVGNNALMDFNATAPGTVPSWGNTAATSGAQRSSTLYLLQLSLNAFGGISRWQARVGEEITGFGNTATGAEVLLSQKGGAASIISGHMIYEVV